MRTINRWQTGLAAAAIVTALAMSHSSWSQSGNHGDGHAELHHIYKDWRTPGNPAVSCCHDEDCRPTRAKRDENGNWLAWTGRKWLTVPSRALMPPDMVGDGRSHICERQDYIYCFTPSEPKI
jgi:hypothetical protein